MLLLHASGSMWCLEAEEVFGIVVANVFYHLVYSFHFAGGYFAVFHVGAQEVAQRATEVLMTRIGEERTGVCEHTHKAAQQTE